MNPKNCSETAPQNYIMKGILSILLTNYYPTGHMIVNLSDSNLGPNFILYLQP